MIQAPPDGPPPGTVRVPPRAPPFWLLAAVTMTGTAALHVFIPALPAVARTFHTTPHTAQLAITLYLIGLAMGQLAYGPLSDRFGRRPLLLWSQALYLAGLLAAIAAPTIGVLLGARLLQSIGASGALVLGRAMVRDIHGGPDAARQLATLGLVMGLTPAVAPALGGLITLWLGWRAVFGVLTLVVGTLSVLVLRMLPETNRTPIALPGPAAILHGYLTLWRAPVFRRFTIAGSCAATSLYGFFAAAPFLLTRTLHQPLASVGFYCLATVVGMMGGTFAARQMARQVPVLRAARVGNLVCLACAMALVAMTTSHHLALMPLIATLVVYAVGVGIVSPNALAGLMNTHPDRAGSASSLYGFLQMAFGAVSTLFVSALYGAPGFPVALSMLAASCLAGWALSGRGRDGTACATPPQPV